MPESCSSLMACSTCCSSPFVKSIISFALCSRTVPLVSVCEMSMGHENTPTLAFVAFVTLPSGDLAKTIPLTTLLCSSAPPMILTTRTLSTLKLTGFLGRTARTASATRSARKSSLPDCFAATTVRIAFASSSCERMSATLSHTSSALRLASSSVFAGSLHTLKNLLCRILCLFVSQNDVACLESHANELLRFLQQLTSKDDDKVCRIAHLCLLLLTGHDQQLRRGVHNLEFPQYCGSVGGKDHLLQVVDDDLIAPKGTKGGLNSLGNRSAGIDVANDGAILSVVAVVGWLAEHTCGRVGSKSSLLVTLLEQPRVRGVGYRERHVGGM